jgi:hypothetical protein
MIPEESQSDQVLASQPPPDARTATARGDSPDDPLTEDLALALLKRGGVLAHDLERIAKNSALMKSRKLRLAVAAHPRTPRRIVLRLIRELYTFELMQFSMMPAAPADLKRSAGELLVARIASVTLGERISLARRSSAQVAAALLLDKETRVWQTALENPRLTEAAVVKSLRSPKTGPKFVESVCGHARWSLRPEIRIALLRNPHTPLARALEFARRLPPPQLRDILHSSRLPEKIKAYLRRELKERPK